MIIKEITLENFRSYYGKHTVKFNDGLVLFVGDNGGGKTTFFEALEWLFDTSKQNMDYRLISEKKIAELPEFESDTLRVEMTFEHDGEKIVEKSFSFKKKPNNEILPSDFQFKGWYVDGVERTPIHGGTLLDRCFEAAIRKYCLFKGEENLNIFNNPDALNYLIETFSNIRQFNPYYTDDKHKTGFTYFAEEQSKNAFDKAMNTDTQNGKQEKELRYDLDKLRRELGDIRQRLRSNRQNAVDYSTKLQEIENSKEASTLLKDINDRLKELNERKYKNESLINEDYTVKLLDEMWILCGFSQIFKEYQEKVNIVRQEKQKLELEFQKEKGKKEAIVELAKGITPLPNYIPDAKTMEELLTNEFCKVCGREAKKGSNAYNFMLNKLEELIKSQQPKDKEEKPLFPNNFIRELDQKSIRLEYNQHEINNLINTIRDKIELNEGHKKRVKKFEDSIANEEDKKKKLLAQNDTFSEEQLTNAFQNISNWWNIRKDAEKQIVILEKEEKEKEAELSAVEEKYNNLAKNSVASTYCKIHIAFDKIKGAFKYAKEKNTEDFLKQLESIANKYLKKLNIDDFYGIIRIVKTSTDPDKREIRLEDSNGVFVVSPNQALKTTMYMSVLFAVSELTTIKRENDYPLIFDAPTSSFAPQKESDFFNVISDIKKQCIIFSKSFLTDNGTLDTTKTDALHCTIYRMEKKKPFDNLDLSTVQTVITPIK
jgi:DNA sulfur modification protein DndD